MVAYASIASAALVALVARRTQVLISVDIRVMEVGCVVIAMANRAGEHGVIRGVGMAGSADPVRIPMVDGEERMVRGGQGCRHPCRRRVACGAGGGPARGSVIGVRGSIEICGVARVAIGRRAGKDIIDVAQVAGYGGVRTGERERRVVVVERS